MVGTDRQLVIDGVGVASEEEEVSVTAINLAGLHSVPLRGRVTFQTTPPTDNGKNLQKFTKTLFHACKVLVACM